MNRKQRRQAKHRNPHLASRALFEEELRRALRKRDVVLVSCTAGQQNDEPRWVLEVKRGGVTMLLSSTPKTVEGMVAAIIARLDNPEESPKVEVLTDAVQPKPSEPITTSAPGNGPTQSVELHEDLSHYLEGGATLVRP